MLHQTKWLTIFILILVKGSYSSDTDSVLECYKRMYNHTIIKKDIFDKSCWDIIPAVACWGRCDSREIPDWKFPYKKSFHSVCMHEVREWKTIILKYCEDDVQPGTEIFEYHQALSCKCSTCKSSEASCEGIRQKETNFHAHFIT